MKFDDALDYIRNPYVTEEIYGKEQRILHIELNNDPESVTLEKAKEFFKYSKLLNLVTIASGDDRVSNIADDALSAFDLAFTTSSTQCEALIQVSDVDEAISGIEASVISNPESSIMLVQLLRQRAYLDVATGLVSESTVYATLQGGPEFQTWISERDALPENNSSASTVLSNRDGSVLTISLNRPDKANAFSAAMRDELVEQLRFAAADTSIQQVITAAVASQISDGAVALMVASERAVKEHGLKPRARIHHISVRGDDPIYMLTGPIPATEYALAKTGMTVDDFDLFECNEAFAPVPIVWMREHNIPHEKVNVNGGAIALGHPLGCTGGRLMTTLLNELERSGGRFGLQTMCEGGGQANVTILECLS